MPIGSQHRFRVVASIVIGALITMNGCTLWQTPAPPESDPANNFGSKLRKPTASGQVSGLDSRAQEIEKNLGVR